MDEKILNNLDLAEKWVINQIETNGGFFGDYLMGASYIFCDDLDVICFYNLLSESFF